jgi:TPR repeat protein
MAVIASPIQDTVKGIEAFNRGDVVAAMGFFQKAAEEGYAPAQVRLAYIFDQSESNEEAAKWYRKAAEQNNAEGKYGLGEMYVSGEGVEQDFKQAILLITEAAEQGLVRAMRNLAIIYEKGGLDLEADHNKTVYWIEKAAESGDQWAIGRLVQAYSHGELGLSVDEKKAQSWKAKLPESEMEPAYEY